MRFRLRSNRDRSEARREPEKQDASADWVQIATFNPVFGEIDADLAVAQLRANGIPVQRFPVAVLSVYVGGAGVVPIRVMVPANRAEEALELLRGDGGVAGRSSD